MCIGIIFTTIPLARSLQKFIYSTVGKEFFTYFVLFTILAGLAVLLYVLIGKLRIRQPSQYLWIILSAGTFIYFTLQLRKHPEEAVHLIEYGLLACLLLYALGHRIKDWTAYITAGLLVAFIGTLDEFIQWMLPSRVWDYKDVGINALAGFIVLFAINRGIKPGSLRGKVSVFSINCVVAAGTVLIIFLGLCLSNTPRVVSLYTKQFPALSWLISEEPMSDYGYKHRDRGIGTFYSRFTKEELREIGSADGEAYGGLFSEHSTIEDLQKLKEQFTPFNDSFFHEFLIHVVRVKKHYNDFMDDENTESARIALFEYRILTKYYLETLLSSGFALNESILVNLRKATNVDQGEYISQTGKLITVLDLEKMWIMVVMTLIALWAGRFVYLRRLL